MLSASVLDTQRVVAYARQNRLLCDFTAFIALEPDKNNPWLANPQNESEIGPSGVRNPRMQEKFADVQFSLIPGSRPAFMIRVPYHAIVELCIFNMSGKKVASLTQAIKAGKTASIACERIKFAKGMYVAVAKIHSQESRCKIPVKTLIERFTLN
jgi:hypothetical protein